MFGDLNKLWISLINEILDLMKKILKFGADLNQHYKKLKFKDKSK
jgi:hypothetical protein